MTATLPDPKDALAHFEAKLAFSTGPVELDRRLREGEDLVIVDVREVEDFAKGHVPGAINLPREQWPTCEGLRKDALNVLCCYSHVCHLAAAAAVEFAAEGYPVMELDGGFEEWKANKLEVEK